MSKKSVYKFLMPISLILSASSLNASDKLLDLPLKDMEKSAKKAFKSLKDKESLIGRREMVNLKLLQKQHADNPTNKDMTYDLGKFYKLRVLTPIHRDLGLRYMISSGAKGQMEAARYIQQSKVDLSIAQKSAVQKIYARALTDKEYGNIAAWSLAAFNKSELDKKLWNNIAELEIGHLSECQKNKKATQLKEEYALHLSGVLSQSYNYFLSLSNPLSNAVTSNFLLAQEPHLGFDKVTNKNNLILPRLNVYKNTYQVKTNDYQNYGRIMDQGAKLDSFAKNLLIFMENHSKQHHNSKKNLTRNLISLSKGQEKTLVAIKGISKNIKLSMYKNKDSRFLTGLEDELLHLQEIEKASIKSLTYLEKLFKMVKRYY